MEFFVYLNDAQQGPFSAEQLRSLPITPETPVWYPGLADWTPAAFAPEVAAIFNQQNVVPVPPTPDYGSRPSDTLHVADDDAHADNADNPQVIDVRTADPDADSQETPAGDVTPPDVPVAGTYHGHNQYRPYGQQQPYQWQSPSPHNSQQQPYIENTPKSYLAWAIIVTILCCIPLGVVAIIYASQVNSYIKRGDMARARRASDRAQGWIVATIVLGLVWGIFYTFLIMPLLSLA